MMNVYVVSANGICLFLIFMWDVGGIWWFWVCRLLESAPKVDYANMELEGRKSSSMKIKPTPFGFPRIVVIAEEKDESSIDLEGQGLVLSIRKVPVHLKEYYTKHIIL